MVVLTLHQRLNEFQNHVLHVTALMLPFSGSFGTWLKTHLSDKFPELVTALLIPLSPRGSAAVRGQGRVSAGLSPTALPRHYLGSGQQSKESTAAEAEGSQGTRQSWLQGGLSSLS